MTLAAGRAAPGAGVGVDLIEIERLERALERRPRLAERLFTPAELELARSRSRPGRHLAARFAAKEATVKALARAVSPRDVEVVGSEPPRLVLHGRAAELVRRNRVTLELSLTHSRELAAAVVVGRPAAAAARDPGGLEPGSTDPHGVSTPHSFARRQFPQPR